MKNLITITALITTLGFAPFLASSAFAQTTQVTPTPVQHYNQAVASWKLVASAKCYNIYYGWVNRKSSPAWNHSVRCVPNNMWKYTIGGLKPDRSYEYTVKAVKYSGSEFSPSTIAPLVATPQM